MKSFHNYLFESQGGQAQIQALEAKAKALSQPENVKQMISRFGVSSVDELIQKLESDPGVQKVLSQYKTLKNKSPQHESIVGDVLGGVWNAVKGIGGWILGTVARTIGHVLGGLFAKDVGTLPKLNYAAMLLLTFGLSGTLLAVGAPVAVAVAAAPMTASWWGIMWFGKAFIEPVLAYAEGVPYRSATS